MLYHFIKFIDMLPYQFKTKMAYWFLFTLLFGLLPILLRLFVFAISGSGIVQPLMLSEVIFLGLMFNVSAVVNISFVTDNPKIAGSSTCLAIILSMILIVLYVVDLIVPVNLYVVLPVVTVTTLMAFMLSFVSANDDVLQEWRCRLDAEDVVKNIQDRSLRDRIEKIVAQRKEGERLDFNAVMDETLRWFTSAGECKGNNE